MFPHKLFPIRRRWLSPTRRFYQLASFTLALLCLSASCKDKATHKAIYVKDVPNLRSAANDPEINLEGLTPTLLSPPDSRMSADPDELESRVNWSPVAEFQLKAGETRVVSLNISQPVTLLVRVLWSGAASPVSVLVTKSGTTIATGAIYPLRSDRGTVIAYGVVSEAGAVNISVHNNGNRVTKIQAIWGTLVEE